MGKELILGIGTGRCGTVSLCELLNNQELSNFTHEEKPLLSWYGDTEKLDNKIKAILSRDGKYIGDIAFNYLPYLEYILENYQGTKIICLKREKSEVVNSYLKKTKGRNHWVNHRGILWKQCDWDNCYPKYNYLIKRNAIKKYWDEYYKTVESLILKYPASIMIMDMLRALNTEEGIVEMLHFIGIEERHTTIKREIKRNAI